jgi:hypothetical protein
MLSIVLALVCCMAAFGQSVEPPAATGFGAQYVLGSGIGFKPYQTPIKAGSSAFVEGGWQFSQGLFAFTRVELRSTDAQMLLEGCKSVFANPANVLMICGGPGFGANGTNIGVSFTGGGKWLFAPAALRRQGAWLGIEMGVDKTTVPAPVTSDASVSPVQPSFRFGIFKVF